MIIIIKMMETLALHQIIVIGCMTLWIKTCRLGRGKLCLPVSYHLNIALCALELGNDNMGGGATNRCAELRI